MNNKINEESSFEVFISFMNFEKLSILKQFQYEIINNKLNFTFFDEFLENIYPGIFTEEEYIYLKDQIISDDGFIIKNNLEIFISKIEKELLNENNSNSKIYNVNSDKSSLNLEKKSLLFKEDNFNNDNVFEKIFNYLDNITSYINECINKCDEIQDPDVKHVINLLEKVKNSNIEINKKIINLELNDNNNLNNIYEQKMNSKDLEIRRIMSIQEEIDEENWILKNKLKNNIKKIKDYNNLKLENEQWILEKDNLENKLVNLKSKFNIFQDELKIQGKNWNNKTEMIETLRSHISILEKSTDKDGSFELKNYNDNIDIKELKKIIEIKEYKIKDLLVNIENFKIINEKQEEFISQQKSDFEKYIIKNKELEEKLNDEFTKNLDFSNKNSIRFKNSINNKISYFGNLDKDIKPIIKQSKIEFRNSNHLTIKSLFHKFNSNNKINSINEVNNENEEVSKLNIFNRLDSYLYKNYKDYLDLINSQKLINNGILKENEVKDNFIFSDFVFVYNKNFKKFKAIILIFNNKIKFLKKNLTLLNEINIDNIFKISLSIKNGFTTLIHIMNEFDIIFDSFKRVEIIYFISNMHKKYNEVNKKFEIKFHDKFILKGKKINKEINLDNDQIIKVSKNLNTLFINSLRISNVKILQKSLFHKKWKDKVLVLTSVGIFSFRENNIYKPENFIPVVSNIIMESNNQKNVIIFKIGEVKHIKFTSELEKNIWKEKINLIKDKNFSLSDLNKKLINIK